MLKFIFKIALLFCFLGVQGQNNSGQFAGFLVDLECLTSIVKQGINNQSWILDNLYEESDTCAQYSSIRKFEVKNDTLVITKIEEPESNKLKEIRLTIQNDSLVLVTLLLKENDTAIQGKSRKLKPKYENQEFPAELKIRFVYVEGRMKIDFFSKNKIE